MFGDEQRDERRAGVLVHWARETENKREREREEEASVAVRGAAHLVNFLGSEGGVGGGSGLLVLSSSW